MVSEAGSNVLAVIPTYRPPNSLRKLIDTLTPQVAEILVSDDASPCTFDPHLRKLQDGTAMRLMRHQKNAGIARCLNDGLALAQASGCEWLLTLDQDSHINAGYVSLLLEEALARTARGVRLGAIGAEMIHDASGDLAYPTSSTSNGPVTEELIQTGTLWCVRALTEIGGFDESLGIDAVDAGACLRLREQDYAIAVAPGLRIEHSIGSSQMIRLLGRSVMVTGHSAQRRTSMLRNRLRLFPAEFRQSPIHALRTIRRVVTNQTLGIVLEQDRGQKALGTLRGLLPRDSRRNS